MLLASRLKTVFKKFVGIMSRLHVEEFKLCRVCFSVTMSIWMKNDMIAIVPVPVPFH